jgi:hypothetical protein
MITASEARDLAQRYVKALEQEAGCELELVDRFTLERPFGWMFFYQSSEYVRTQDPVFQLAGNGGLIVNRQSGTLTVAGSANTPEYYLDQYAAGLDVGGA